MYTVQSNYVMVKFAALANAIVRDYKVPKHQSTGVLDDYMVLKIIEILKEEPDISQDAIGGAAWNIKTCDSEKIKLLKEAGRIERVGGKRYGHWVIHE